MTRPTSPSAAAAPGPVTPDWIDETAFRRGLQKLRDTPLNEAEGLFGPRSIFWEVNRHAVVYFLGAVQSVQMQLCHPWIATAVFEHSKIMSNPRQRARLTYTYLWSLIYGDLEQVERMALALYRVHQRVEGELHEDAGQHAHGDRYGANEAHALLWVHVTAFYCRVMLYERLVRPLAVEEKDRFAREAQRYAYCFGIPAEIQPATWQEVEAYVDGVVASGALGRTEPGLKIRRFLEASIPLPLRRPLWTFLCTLLPAPLQQMLEQPTCTPENLRSARITGRVLRILQRRLPAKLAYVPAWHEARARIAGESGPDWLTARINTLLLGRARLVS